MSREKNKKKGRKEGKRGFFNMPDKPEKSGEDGKSKKKDGGLSLAQKGFIGIIVFIFVMSVAGRAATGPAKDSKTQQRTASSENPLATGFAENIAVPDEQAPQRVNGGSLVREEEPGALERFLPYLTEGSFFALIGFAIGYTTRKLVKILLVLVAVGFVLVQLLSSGGLTSVDWGGVISRLNGWIFNLKENQSFTQILTDRIPSSGAFLLGVVLGFRRG